MTNYGSQSNNTADCQVLPQYSDQGILDGFIVTSRGLSSHGATRVHTRLVEAGLSVDRFIDLEDGTKRPIRSHTDPANQRGVDHVKGNYGVLAGNGLLIIDVDAPEKLPTSVVQLLAQHPTLRVSSPHGTNARAHYFYRVEGTIKIDKATLTRDWGSILIERSYAVGPGSAIKHDEYCGNDCALSGKGAYELRPDRPIATLPTDALEPTLRDDEPEGPEPSDSDAITITDINTRIKRGIAANQEFRELWEWAREGGPPARVGFVDDRSGAETALSAHLHFWLSGDTDAVRRAFNKVNPPKWKESGQSYRQSVLTTGDNGEYYDPESGGGGVSWNAIFEVIRALCDDHDGQARTQEIVASDPVTVGQRQVVNALNQLKEMGYLYKTQDDQDGRVEYWVVENRAEITEFAKSDDLLDQYNSRKTQREWCRNHL